MTLFHLELVEGIEAILTATRVEGVLRPARLLHVDFVQAVFHADVRKLFANQGQGFFMPELGEGSVVSFANEQYDEADNEEGHKATLHGELLRKDHGVEWLFRCSCF